MSTEPATPSPEADRPGGWIEGIGWVAYLTHLPIGTKFEDSFGPWTMDSPDEAPADIVRVLTWPDGTTPSPVETCSNCGGALDREHQPMNLGACYLGPLHPAAPSSSGEAQRGWCLGTQTFSGDAPCGNRNPHPAHSFATAAPVVPADATPAASGEAQDPPEAEMVLADLRPILSDLTAAVLAWRNEYRQDVERAAAKDKTNDWASARILACDAFLALLAPAGGEGTDR